MFTHVFERWTFLHIDSLKERCNISLFPDELDEIGITRFVRCAPFHVMISGHHHNSFAGWPGVSKTGEHLLESCKSVLPVLYGDVATHNHAVEDLPFGLKLFAELGQRIAEHSCLRGSLAQG